MNLTLYILAKRPDGYHELETRMQKLDLSDEITLSIRKQAGISLSCTDPEVPEDESNLAWKAADAFFRSVSRSDDCGVHIHLVKNIPVAAGLGGGSSDAGTVLKGLNILFQTGLSQEKLLELARPLGADVPFFAHDETAVVATGIGEKMDVVEPLGKCDVLLVNPGFSVSTRWVYENYTLTTTDKTFKDVGFKKKHRQFHFSELYNDLEKVTVKSYPVINEIKQTLTGFGADGVLMSGSGPTVFGIFENTKISQFQLEDVVVKLKKLYGENVFLTKCAGAWPSGEGTGF